MATTRKLSRFELANLIHPAKTGPTGTQRIGAFDLEAAESGRIPIVQPDSHDDDDADVGVSMGDRLTPVDMPIPSRHDAGSISIPPAAVEVTTPRAVQQEPDAATDPRALKTQLARRFSSLADKVNERFADFQIGAGRWSLELTAPEGMSTANGKQALQHLRLRPHRDGFPTLLAGTVNAMAHTAELRNYTHMTQLHAARFGRSFEAQISEGEWEQLLRRCEVTLKHAEIDAVRISASAGARPRPWAMRAVRIPRKLVVGTGLVIAALITLMLVAIAFR